MSKTPNKPAAPKPITLTIDIAPPQKGQRQIIVSGAPAGEMPIVHTGAFAELHTLINTTWAELQRREPQVPTITAEKPEPAAKPVHGAKAEPVSSDDDDVIEPTVDDKVEDTKEDDGEVPSDARYQTPTAPAVIENDQLVVSTEEGLPAIAIAGDTAASLTPLEQAIIDAQQETTQHG